MIATMAVESEAVDDALQKSRKTMKERCRLSHTERSERSDQSRPAHRIDSEQLLAAGIFFARLALASTASSTHQTSPYWKANFDGACQSRLTIFNPSATRNTLYTLMQYVLILIMFASRPLMCIVLPIYADLNL